MTYEQLKNIIEKNNIPEDVHLMSNSGWECCATEMDGVLWIPTYNEIHFTQDTKFYTDAPYHWPYKKDDKDKENPTFHHKPETTQVTKKAPPHTPR